LSTVKEVCSRVDHTGLVVLRKPGSGGAKGGGAARARAPAVKPCAPATPRQLSYSDVDHKRISWLRATDYFEDVNYDVINHAE